jgi:hypothetical protein
MVNVTLEPAEIVRTLEKLVARIEARFPSSGLSDVARTVTGLAARSADEAARLARPNWGLRLLSYLIIAATVAGAVVVLSDADFHTDTNNAFALVQSIEAMMNIALVAGAAIFSLVTIETRLRRAAALKAVHKFRALIHVIDMHQLTKDPSVAPGTASITSVSPKRDLTPFQLSRYLDYCSELLSLTAKTVALYAIASDDGAVATAVNEIEQLTSGLSAKIWQKIMIIKAGEDEAAGE